MRAGAVALEQPELFSLLALRSRAIRLWLAAIGLAAFGAAYVGPIALAIRTPDVSGLRVVQLPALSLPTVELPTLAVPKLNAPPTTAPFRATPAPTTRRVVHRVVHRVPARAATKQNTKTVAHKVQVPVVKDSYTVAPAVATAPANSKQTKDPFAGATVTEDTTGGVPAPGVPGRASATRSPPSLRPPRYGPNTATPGGTVYCWRKTAGSTGTTSA